MSTLFATHTGKLIDLANIKKSDICLEDIAHHLTKIQRYGGALPLGVAYSVASHSLNLCNYYLSAGLVSHAKIALLHDATEAYLGDVVSGLKSLLAEYTELESSLFKLIANKYINFEYDNVLNDVSRADKRIVINEVSDLINIENQYLYVKYGVTDKRARMLPMPRITPDKYIEHIKALFLKTCALLFIYD